MTMIDILRVVLALPETIEQLRKEMNRMQVDLTKLCADVDTLKTETAAALTRVAEDVQALKDQSASGSGVTQADIDGIATSIQDVITSIKGLDPIPPGPLPTP
jgi:methyl-accepting chemotaxis protein